MKRDPMPKERDNVSKKHAKTEGAMETNDEGKENAAWPDGSPTNAH